MKPLHIFKPGRHQPMSGGSLDFTERDLIASANAYNPSLHEAPLVLGHPAHDAPAAGWVKSLRATADGLIAEPQQVDAAFAEQIAQGSYKKISASFYHPDSPNNPVPGVYYLRHVGFLGAMPPSVKGLRPIELAEDEQGIVEFADLGQDASASLWRKFREFLIARFGTETADTVAPSWQIETLSQTTRDSGPSPAFADSQPAPNQSQAMTEQEQRDLLAENQRLQNNITQREKTEQATARAALHTAHTEFAEQLVKHGMKPMHCQAVIAALDFVEAQDTPLEFGEHEDRQPLAEGLKALFSELTGKVNFSEQASKERAGHAPDTTPNPLLADAQNRCQ
jgi:hypothetical protein